MNRKRLRGLYAITDEKLISETDFTVAIEQALSGGAAIIQYRDKSANTNKRLEQALALRTLCNEYNARLIINDDINLAKTVAADGVHLGENDISIDQARLELGAEAIIGISCYNLIERALDAQSAGADYVAFGAVYTSSTKPEARQASCELIRDAKARLEIPVCAIGGINKSNAGSVIDAGADMTAVISGLFADPDIRHTAEHIAGLFD
ncbi:MAG: thiamine phosphate synthase [Gammaproteobacteria bacterium]